MSTTTRPFHAALRQNLTRDRFDQQLQAMVAACARGHIQEVVLFPDLMDHPDRLAGFIALPQARADQPLIERARQAVTAAGMAFSLHIWHTLGHSDRGRDMRAGGFDFQPLVDHEGFACRANVCPLCPAWRQYYAQLAAIYCLAQPTRFFLDDDFRLTGHATIDGHGRFTCFCPLHLQAFNQRHGLQYDRPALLRDILQPGTPHPTRALWLDFSHWVLADTVTAIRQAVHQVSPDTQLGLMTGTPDTHALEGRDWPALLQAMAGPDRPLVVRPHFPPYEDGRVRDLPHNLLVLRHTRACLPPDQTRHFTEIDNCPPSAFNRSPNQVAASTMACALLGVSDFHYSLFEFEGNPSTFTDNHAYVLMLDAIRPAVEQVLAWTGQGGQEWGLKLPHLPRSAYHRPTTLGRDLNEWRIDSLAMARTLQATGFPVTFHQTPARVLTGHHVAVSDDPTLRAWLSGRVLLDATAAEQLVARGLGSLIGIRTITPPPPLLDLLGGEQIVDPALDRCREWVRYRSLGALRVASWELADDVHPITRLVSREGKPLGPGAFTFRNQLGGSIAAVNAPPEVFDSTGYANELRRCVLNRMCQFLFEDHPWLRVEGSPLLTPLVLQTPDHGLVVGVFSGQTSPAASTVLHLHHHPFRQVEAFVFGDLRWRTSKPHVQHLTSSQTVIRLDDPIPVLGFAVFRLTA